jgi:nucleoside-diphosphate-sugar epimerase
MRNKVVFITGARGALGTSVTERFLSTGATVVGVSRDISKENFPQPNFLPFSVQPLPIRGNLLRSDNAFYLQTYSEAITARGARGIGRLSRRPEQFSPI